MLHNRMNQCRLELDHGDERRFPKPWRFPNHGDSIGYAHFRPPFPSENITVSNYYVSGSYWHSKYEPLSNEGIIC